MIADELGGLVSQTLDIKDATTDDLNNADGIIMGTSTWQEGELQDDWESFVDDLGEVNFAGKTVAFFGMGDQQGYAEYFCGGMFKLYEKAKAGGAKIVGAWPTDGYDFETSAAVVDGKFVGLALDEDNQPELTDERIKTWCGQIKGSL
jgi:flavodoxin I